MPKYNVIYSISDTYETTIEVDWPEDIQEYLNMRAGEEVWHGKSRWVGAGIIVERYYPVKETENA